MGIDDKEYAVGHVERTLHLTAEISVSWRIDDVDLVLAIVIGIVCTIVNARLLGRNGDAALVLLVARVHDELLAHLGLIVTKGIALFEQSVHHSRLAMVNVGDDSDVADVFSVFHKNTVCDIQTFLDLVLYHISHIFAKYRLFWYNSKIMTSGTIFERVWTDPASPFLYKNEVAGVGIVADVFPKFPDQVVLVPAQGFPEREEASLSDLPFATQLALAALQSAMDKKMRSFSGVPAVRGVARVDGYVVPNHPHIVMFPALRGESGAYTEASRFTDEEIRALLVERTMQNLALTPSEIDELNEKLRRIQSIDVPS